MKTIKIEDNIKAIPCIDPTPTMSIISEIDKKIEEINKKCSNIGEKIAKIEENANILAEKIEKLEEKLEKNYIDIEYMKMRRYLILTDFLGTVKSRKLKKILKGKNIKEDGLCDLSFQNRVIDYDKKAILTAYKIVKKIEKIDNLVQKYK